jgi:hypothetical protein
MPLPPPERLGRWVLVLAVVTALIQLVMGLTQ